MDNRRRMFRFIIGMGILPFMLTVAFAAVPNTINYQGYLTDNSGNPITSAVSITFNIYSVAAGGAPLWAETHTNIPVNMGIYNVILGSVTSLGGLAFDVPYYLGVAVGSDPEMIPRQPLTSVGYAFTADTAEVALDLNCAQCISQSELDFPVDGATLNAGDGLVKEGDTLHVGSGAGISVQSDWVSIPDGGVISSMLADSAVTTEKIHGNAITTAKIADNAVGSAKIIDLSIGPQDIAFGAVTTEKINGAGAVAGQVLKYNGSAVGWDTDQAGGITLPYGGTVNSAATAFSITQNGTGWGINGESSGTIGIRGRSNAGSGAGVAGYAQGSGGVGIFGQGQGKGVEGYVNQPGAYALYGNSTGSGGVGVYGAGPAWAGYFSGNLYAGGRLGICTENPARAIHVAGNNPRILVEGIDSSSPEINLRGSSGDDWALYRHGTAGDLRFYQAGDKIVFQNSTGNVGIGTNNPIKKLTVRGNILLQSASTGTSLIELGEGLDYAEGFHVSNKSNVVPGSILVIDPNNPGTLMLSGAPYDRKVAGIVAGAKGLGSAVRLGVGQFDRDVALAGRVYCNVDATYGEVKPGDLLTTSPTPGYAMVVKNYMEAQGAILGKAMEQLDEGEKGQILVLVTLQ